MSALVVIPARYGSTRFPGKPLAMLQGKPMIQHVYERVVQAEGVAEVVVATDDERIAHAVTQFHGPVVMTSRTARSGTERVAEVARTRAARVVVNVQGDEPLVHPEMVALLIETLTRHQAIPMASLRTALTRREDVANPNVVKVVVDQEQFALYFSRAPIPFAMTNGASPSANPHGVIWSKHLGIYAYQRHFLLKVPSLIPTALEQAESLEQLRVLEHGYRIQVLQTPHDTISVDTPEDLRRVQDQLGERG